MKTPLLAIVLAATACAEPVVEMKLELPQQTPAGFDMSCVTAVWVYALGETFGEGPQPDFGDLRMGCVPVSNVTSYAGLQQQIRGQFALEIPDSGLAALELSGVAGSCDDQLPHESIFYGGAPAIGDSIKIPVVSNLSCDQRQSYTVRAVDMLALSSTGQCGAMASGRLIAGDVRPIALGPEFPNSRFEWGSSASSLWNMGTTVVEAFTTSANPKTCAAIGYDTESIAGTQCINAGAPTLCGAPGELELPIIPFDYAGQSRDPELFARYGQPVLGVAYERGTAATKTPVQGATVTLDDPSQGAVVYVQRGPTSFVPRQGATSTDAGGFFLVYLKGDPTTITVTSPLHGPQRYTVAAPIDSPSTLIAALNRR